MVFSALLDCGSSHCFIDLSWAVEHGLPLHSTTPMKLVLIDGTSNAVITQESRLTLRFASGETTPFTFYVTPLGASCPMVLGLNWLTRYNPLVDWALRSVTFRTLSQETLHTDINFTALKIHCVNWKNGKEFNVYAFSM